MFTYLTNSPSMKPVSHPGCTLLPTWELPLPAQVLTGQSQLPRPGMGPLGLWLLTLGSPTPWMPFLSCLGSKTPDQAPLPSPAPGHSGSRGRGWQTVWPVLYTGSRSLPLCSVPIAYSFLVDTLYWQLVLPGLTALLPYWRFFHLSQNLPILESVSRPLLPGLQLRPAFTCPGLAEWFSTVASPAPSSSLVYSLTVSSLLETIPSLPSSLNL